MTTLLLAPDVAIEQPLSTTNVTLTLESPMSAPPPTRISTAMASHSDYSVEILGDRFRVFTDKKMSARDLKAHKGGDVFVSVKKVFRADYGALHYERWSRNGQASQRDGIDLNLCIAAGKIGGDLMSKAQVYDIQMRVFGMICDGEIDCHELQRGKKEPIRFRNDDWEIDRRIQQFIDIRDTRPPIFAPKRRAEGDISDGNHKRRARLVSGKKSRNTYEDYTGMGGRYAESLEGSLFPDDSGMDPAEEDDYDEGEEFRMFGERDDQGEGQDRPVYNGLAESDDADYEEEQPMMPGILTEEGQRRQWAAPQTPWNRARTESPPLETERLSPPDRVPSPEDLSSLKPSISPRLKDDSEASEGSGRPCKTKVKRRTKHEAHPAEQIWAAELAEENGARPSPDDISSARLSDTPTEATIPANNEPATVSEQAIQPTSISPSTESNIHDRIAIKQKMLDIKKIRLEMDHGRKSKPKMQSQVDILVYELEILQMQYQVKHGEEYLG